MSDTENQRWRLLFDQTPLGFIEWDLDWNIMSWNPSAERIFGWSAQEAIGQSVYLIIPDVARPHVDGILQKIISQKGGLRSSNQNVTKSGRIIDCEWYNTPLLDDSGKTIGAASLAQDVTDQLVAQRRVLSYSLRLSDINTNLLKLSRSSAFHREDLQTILKEITEVAARGLNVAFASVWFFDSENTKITCAHSYVVATNTHGTEEDILVSEFPTYFRSLREDRMIVAHNAQLDERTREFSASRLAPLGITSDLSVATRLRGDIAGLICFEHAGNPREWSPEEQVFAGAIADLISLALEARERQRAEAEQRKLEGQLFQSQKMEALGTLAGGIAHDFNNIIATILGSAELALVKSESDQNPSDQIKNISTAAIRARDLVQQILTFSRKRLVEIKPILIQEAVEDSLKLIRSTFPATVDIQSNLRAPHTVILSDPSQVHQILVNLCTNALHACAGYQGTLRIALQVISLDSPAPASQNGLKAGNYVELIVSDNGCGMESSVLRQVFDPFFTTKDTGEGTGLGLSIVHSIMATHEGVITASSVKGEGSTFQLLFPVSNLPPYHSETDKQEIYFGNGEEILLVDDDIHVLRMGSELLSYLRYTVHAHSNPLEALEAFRAEPSRYALVMTDLTMPKTTGVELAEQIGELSSTTPIILTSGFGSEVDIGAAGVSELLPKPFLLHTLSEAVFRALSRTHQIS